MTFLRNVFIANRFYYAVGALIVAMAISYSFPFLFPVAKTAVVLFLIVTLADVVLLFNRRTALSSRREVDRVLSLGDDNAIHLHFFNRSPLALWTEVVDEVPEQFQMRNFSFRVMLPAYGKHAHTYYLRPLTRGNYGFGKTHLFCTTAIGLIKRRFSIAAELHVPVYPSLIQMRKYELKTLARAVSESGVKKVRRIGHSYEFEHIKAYQRGDDYRSINWKATGRRAQLMVNQYEDERSQPVYSIIDMSRVMHMPFQGLSLFDYAVNASLVIANIVLQKQDKAGLITFAEKPRTLISASRNRTQLKKIMEALYRESEAPVEAGYESLYLAVRRLVNSRSLLFLYTNFESTYALHRALPQLRKLNQQHLLVVVFFENTEITTQFSSDAGTVEDIYTQITAEHYALTKIQLTQQLKQFGISTILTKPENLTVNTINKYLELKSRGMI